MSSYSWVETLPSHLFSLEEKPQFALPPFPWEEFEQRLRQQWGQPDLKVVHSEKGWVEKIPFSKTTALNAIYVGQLSLPLFWVHHQLDNFLEVFFGTKQESSYFFNDAISEGFSQFIALEILKTANTLNFAPPLTFHLGDLPSNYKELLEKHPFFEIDITFEFEKHTIATSLFITSELRSMLKKQDLPFFLNPNMMKKVEFEIALEVGQTIIDRNDLKGAKEGDFIVLDHCSYDPEAEEGWVVLTLNQEGIFRGKFKKPGIKILEFPRLEEPRREMEEESEYDNEEVLLDEERKEESAAITVEKLPVQLIVEVSRIKMTLEELSKLNTGSLLELPVSPEEGVDLVINGKKIGKGELVKMGDILGVRITKL